MGLPRAATGDNAQRLCAARELPQRLPILNPWITGFDPSRGPLEVTQWAGRQGLSSREYLVGTPLSAFVDGPEEWPHLRPRVGNEPSFPRATGGSWRCTRLGRTYLVRSTHGRPQLPSRQGGDGEDYCYAEIRGGPTEGSFRPVSAGEENNADTEAT